jgi:hypothetical protein
MHQNTWATWANRRTIGLYYSVRSICNVNEGWMVAHPKAGRSYVGSHPHTYALNGRVPLTGGRT